MDGRAASAVPATDEGRWKISSVNAEEEQEEEGAANERGGVGAVYGHRRGASFTDRRSVAHHLGHGRTVSASSVQDAGEWVNQPPRFVRDTSKFWHKPDLTRDEAINLLLDKEPGSFVVRNSNTFPGSFGLALKVSQVPPSMQTKGGDPKVDLIRHFLIEPTPKGVRLKGSTNEPVFASLTALIYQHSITPLSLPCKLRLPDRDISGSDDFDGAAHMSGLNSINQGPACTVLFLSSVGTENLTGPEALSRSIKDLFESGRSLPRSTIVQFKASKDGVTLTDNRRRLFFRRFYPIETVTFCGSDPRDRRWTVQTEDVNTTGRAFGFVARKPGVTRENACHVFLELDPTQPADVIVNFVTKILIGQGQLPLQT